MPGGILLCYKNRTIPFSSTKDDFAAIRGAMLALVLLAAFLISGGRAIADFSLQYYDGAAWVTFPGGGVTGNTATDRNVIFSSPVAETT
jgi:hypothetical protein